MNEENEQFDDDSDGRDDRGRFAPGNPGGPGRPTGDGTAGRFRRKLMATLTDRDIELAVEALRDVLQDTKAKNADRIAAARELLDRSAGRPLPSDLLDLVEAAERLVSERGGK